MFITSIVTAWLALLLLAAHLLRDGYTLLIAACLAAMALALVPRRWAERLIEWVLIIAAAEWLRTTYVLYQARQASDQPWLRMVVILLAVAAFTAAAAWLMHRRARSHPRAESPA